MVESLSRVQIAHFKQAFDVLDKDQDGRLGPEDLLKVLTSLGEEKFSLEECKKLVDQSDTIGDGMIDFVEFLSYMAVRTKSGAISSGVLTPADDEKNVKDMFMKFTGGKDTLTLEAFSQVAKKMRESWAHGDDGEAQLAATFTSLSGGSATMSFEQFKTAIDAF